MTVSIAHEPSWRPWAEAGASHQRRAAISPTHAAECATALSLALGDPAPRASTAARGSPGALAGLAAEPPANRRPALPVRDVAAHRSIARDLTGGVEGFWPTVTNLAVLNDDWKAVRAVAVAPLRKHLDAPGTVEFTALRLSRRA